MNFNKLFFVLETKSQTIKISLKNDVLVHQGTFEGTYEMSTPVNGKPSWISSTNAIWCTPDDTDYWIIGKLDDIGTDFGYIHSEGMFLGQNEWLYWNGSELKTPKENDIIVECVAREGESCIKEIVV